MSDNTTPERRFASSCSPKRSAPRVLPDKIGPIATMFAGLQEAVRARLFEAVAVEREACAREADEESRRRTGDRIACDTADRIAAAIRARGRS